jgi:PAS domain S-box-containing protein
MTNITEQGFLNNQNIFRTLIEESPGPVGLYVGRSMQIKIANKSIINIFAKGDDVIDKLYFELLPELKTQPIFDILNHVYDTGIPYEATEARVDIVVNGKLEIFYFNFVFTPIKNNDGEVWGILNTGADVTELVLTRLKLKESEERKQATIARNLKPEKNAHNEQYKLLTLIDHSSDFVSLSDLDGNVSYVNAAGRLMLGIKDQQELERHNSGYVMPADITKLANVVNKGLMEDGKWSGEINFRHFETGEAIPVMGTTMLVYDTVTGKPQGRATIARDMRREIADRQKLNDQIKQFEFVTDFMPVLLWTASTDGNIDYVNQRTIDYFGIEPEQVIGSSWLNLVHPEDRDGCIAAWTSSINTGNMYHYEFRLLDKNGDYKWHLAQALPFVNDGKIIKWFGTSTNIDEQKQLQRQKDDFLGIASHELKTPVTSIKAYAQVLGAMLTREGETKKAEMVTRMDAQVNRLTNLIGDLLDVTKINSGRLQFNKVWFDLNQAIKETVDDLQHTTQKHKLVEDFGETGQIYSDKDRIGQVITNLITNAIKYSPHTDKIIVSTRLKNNEAIVCVQDFGIGIPGDKKDKVFEQFYRVSGDKQHTFPGLGLGLYISSEIIKREGGRMWVNSIEGKGSTFCFALPVDGNER